MSICYLLDGETPPARQNGKRLPCVWLQAEKEELQAENAHLLESVQNAEHEESVAWDMVRSAERRNDKLRELLAELYQCSRQCGCDRCGYKDECAMFDRMRELGVEV